MGSAARHRERPEEPPPDASAAIAELGRIGGETDAIIGRMNRIDGGPQLILEAISLAAHWAEAREQLEALAARLPSLGEAHRMGVAEGRRVEAAERDAAEAERAIPVRHRHRKPRLSVVGGTAAAASLVAAASAGVGIAAQDSAAVHHVASRPAAARFHAGPADSAVPVPSWSPPARPSAAVASAHPAPVVTASPPPSSSPPPAPAPSWSPPPPPVTVPAGPVLVAPSLLDLGGSHFGTLPLSVTGSGEVAWTATATDGITLGSPAGVVVSGQAVELQVDDPTGNGGWIYFSAGSQALAVHVVPFGAPAVALP